MLEKGGSLVFGLSETWLDDRITDLELEFLVLRCSGGIETEEVVE